MDVATQELLEDYAVYMEEVKKFVNALYQRSPATAKLVPLSEVEYGGFIEVFMSRSFHTLYLQPAGSSVGYLEKLAWCGDRVLGLITTNYLIKKYPGADIGFIDKAYHRRVNNAFLNTLVTQHLGLKDLVIVQTERWKLGADMFEALMYKMFQFHGFETTQSWMLDVVMPIMDAYLEHKDLREDYKRLPRLRKLRARRTAYADYGGIAGSLRIEPLNGSRVATLNDSSDDGRQPRIRRARTKRRRVGEWRSVPGGAEVIEITDDSSDGCSDIGERAIFNLTERPCVGEVGGLTEEGNVPAMCRDRHITARSDRGLSVQASRLGGDGGSTPRAWRKRYFSRPLDPLDQVEPLSRVEMAYIAGSGDEMLSIQGGDTPGEPLVRSTTPLPYREKETASKIRYQLSMHGGDTQGEPLVRSITPFPYREEDGAAQTYYQATTLDQGDIGGHPEHQWLRQHRLGIPPRPLVLTPLLVQGGSRPARAAPLRHDGDVDGRQKCATMRQPCEPQAKWMPVLLPRQQIITGLNEVRIAGPCALDASEPLGSVIRRTDDFSVDMSSRRPAEGGSADRPIELLDDEPGSLSAAVRVELSQVESGRASSRGGNSSPPRHRTPSPPRDRNPPRVRPSSPPRSCTPPSPPCQRSAGPPPPPRDYKTELLNLMNAAAPGALFETVETTSVDGIRRHRCHVSVPGVGDITASATQKDVAEQTAAKDMMERIMEWATRRG